jgi:hypothetical protein
MAMAPQYPEEASDSYRLRTKLLVAGIVLSATMTVGLSMESPELPSPELSLALSILGFGAFLIRAALKIWDRSETGEEPPYRFKVADTFLTCWAILSFVMACILAINTLWEANSQRSFYLLILGVVSAALPLYAIHIWRWTREILKVVRDAA